MDWIEWHALKKLLFVKAALCAYKEVIVLSNLYFCMCKKVYSILASYKLILKGENVLKFIIIAVY